MVIFSISAVVTTLAVANTVNVYRISKQRGAGGVTFSDEPVVDFPLVRSPMLRVHVQYNINLILTTPSAVLDIFRSARYIASPACAGW